MMDNGYRWSQNRKLGFGKLGWPDVYEFIIINMNVLLDITLRGVELERIRLQASEKV